jgi:hypothetical protein
MSGSITDLQIPLMIIDRRGVSIMSTYSLTCRLTHVMLNDTRVEIRYSRWLDRKFIRSPRWDPRKHEEFWNGLENKIHIWEIRFRVSEKFSFFPISYQGNSSRFWRVPQRDPSVPKGPRGPRVAPRPIWAWDTDLLWPMRPAHRKP